MPRILRIVNRFNLGGPTYNAANLTRYLPEEYETLLVGGTHQAHEASSRFILDNLGVDYHAVEEMGRSLHWMRDRQALKALGHIMDEFKPDIVHTHASKAGALGRLAAHRRKVPVIVHTFHGHVFDGYFGTVKTALVKNTERYLARLSDAIVAISPLQRDALVHQYKIAPAHKVHTVPLGFQLERFWTDQPALRQRWRAEQRLLEDEVAIGIIGRLTEIKDHRFFLKVIAGLQTEVPVRAFVIGGGELEQVLQAQAAELGLTSGDRPRLHFVGWEQEVEKPLAGLDVVVLTSRNEGTPVSLIEAQAAGKPVVSTDVGGVRDVVLDNRSGFVVRPGDVEDFQDKVSRLVSDPELRDTFGHEGHAHVCDAYAHTRLAADMDALYKQLLGQEQA